MRQGAGGEEIERQKKAERLSQRQTEIQKKNKKDADKACPKDSRDFEVKLFNLS